MSMVQELIFSVSEKTLKDGSTAVVLTDSEGYLCGIYATVADAEKAIPAIKRNITQGYVSKSCLVKQRNRTNTRQVSNRK